MQHSEIKLRPKFLRFRVHYLRTENPGTISEHHERVAYDVTVASADVAATHVRMMEAARGNRVVIGKIKILREERRGVRR